VPIGAGCDGVAYDPRTDCAYASNGEGTITVIHFNEDKTVETAAFPTRKGARTIVDNPATGRLYLPTADFAPVPAGAKAGTRPAMIEGSFQIIEVGQTR